MAIWAGWRRWRCTIYLAAVEVTVDCQVIAISRRRRTISMVSMHPMWTRTRVIIAIIKCRRHDLSQLTIEIDSEHAWFIRYEAAVQIHRNDIVRRSCETTRHLQSQRVLTVISCENQHSAHDWLNAQPSRILLLNWFAMYWVSIIMCDGWRTAVNYRKVHGIGTSIAMALRCSRFSRPKRTIQPNIRASHEIDLAKMRAHRD